MFSQIDRFLIVTVADDLEIVDDEIDLNFSLDWRDKLFVFEGRASPSTGSLEDSREKSFGFS